MFHQKYDILEFQTNFDDDKIRNLFSNFRTLDLIELFNLKKDYEKLDTYDEIEIHLYQLLSLHMFMLYLQCYLL